jgi:hypothetical protein
VRSRGYLLERSYRGGEVGPDPLRPSSAAGGVRPMKGGLTAGI